jgi:hypothetical protein
MIATRRVASAVAGLTLVLIAALPTLAASSRPTAAASPPPSAIGNEQVNWLAVSPAYGRTGVVVVVSDQAAGCSKDCHHLWVTRDRGTSWNRAGAKGWSGTQTLIALDASGREILFDSSPTGVVRSDDVGQSWKPVGGPGRPSVSAHWVTDRTIAVAGTKDYLFKDAAIAVSGSGGAITDMSFMLSPGFPQGSRFPAALLSGADAHANPVIQQCTADLTCHGNARLPGTEAFAPFAIPALLYPSSDFDTSGVVFAQSGRGVYKSSDGGATFEKLILTNESFGPYTTPMLALSPGYLDSRGGGSIYVALLQISKPGVKPARASGGIRKSTDGGRTWSTLGIGTALERGARAVAVAPDGRIFSGYLPGKDGHSGLLCSRDGSDWTADCAATGAVPAAPSPLWSSVITGAAIAAAALTTLWLVRVRRRAKPRP